MTTTDRPNTTDGGGAPRAEASKAESDLDKLLSTYDSEAKPEKPAAPDARLLKTIEPVIEFAKNEMAARERKAFDEDVEKAVGFMQEAEELKQLKPRMLRRWLEGLAAEDAEFVKAFQARKASPKSFETALARVRAEFIEELKSLPANMVKTDIAAAKAAVSGEKQPAETPEDIEKLVNGMSDQEFLAFRGKRLAEARG